MSAAVNDKKLSTDNEEEGTSSKTRTPSTALSPPDGLVIFDGGTGREIERIGGPFRQPEWSALALYQDPDIVRKVHESYIDAGATYITTNSYAVVPFHLGEERYQRDGKRLLKLAVDLAVQAKGNRKDVSILGSIPPMCGSYEPESFDENKAAAIVDTFLDAYQDEVDALLIETAGSKEEAEFYLKRIRQSSSCRNLPVWLSFCMKSNYGDNQPRLLTNEVLQDAIQYLTAAGLLDPQMVPAVLVNCCDLRLVLDSVKELRALLPEQIRVGAYPNAFSIPPPDAANHVLRQVDFNITPQVMKEHAKQWIEEGGATVLGGCCGVGPAHIQAMASLKTQDTCNNNKNTRHV